MNKSIAASVTRLAGLLLAFAVASPVFAQSQNARPQPACTNASLKGNFGFTAKGVTLATSPVPASLRGLFASSGTSTFDGKGNFTLTSTSSFNGVITPTPAKGTYTVNSDCTYTSASESGITFFGAITNNGNELLILQTTPGVVIVGTAQSQQRALPDFADVVPAGRSPLCANMLSNSSYGFYAEGAAGPPTLPAEMAGPLDGAGAVTFNADGTFLLKAVRSVNGVIDPQVLALKGTYAANADCTLKMNFEVGFTFSGAIVNGGRGIEFVETDAGTTLIVKAVRM